MALSPAALAAEPTVGAESTPAADASASRPLSPARAAKASNGSDSVPEAEPVAKKPAPDKDEYANPEGKGGSEHVDERFGHAMQFGLRAGLAGGYRMIFRYDKSPFCHAPDPTKSDKDQQKFCGNAAPVALDLGLSFGVIDFIEPYFWARFGLAGESSTNTEALMALGAGARIYTNSDSKLKIFIEPAVAVELEGGAGNKLWVFHDTGVAPEYKKDFLFHLGVGPQYDFARAFGLYANAGLTTGVLRYIHTELEVTLGAQVRVP